MKTEEKNIYNTSSIQSEDQLNELFFAISMIEKEIVMLCMFYYFDENSQNSKNNPKNDIRQKINSHISSKLSSIMFPKNPQLLGFSDTEIYRQKIKSILKEYPKSKSYLSYYEDISSSNEILLQYIDGIKKADKKVLKKIDQKINTFLKENLLSE